VERLRLGWLPGDPISEQRVEMCEGDEVTSYAYTEGRVQLRQVEDPDHRWARGAGTGWRQRTLEARRLEWRTGDDGVVVFQRIGDSVTWVTAIGFSPEETLRAAASLTAM
jgi:hypothetical protein